jgi:hypothetical protein
MELRVSVFVNKYVISLFVVQVAGWIALVATFDHSPGAVVGWVQALPEAVRLPLLPLGLLAIPALGIALAVGWLLSLAGLPPETIPTILIAQGDVLVFASAYIVAVATGRGIARIAEAEEPEIPRPR